MQSGALQKALYSGSLGIISITFRGHFILLLPILARNYGISGGVRVFAVAMTFNALSSLFNIAVLNLFLHSNGELFALGFDGICYLYAGFGTIAFLILMTFKNDKVDI